jgi:DNA-binding GntR family transcriptional regulator
MPNRKQNISESVLADADLGLSVSLTERARLGIEKMIYDGSLPPGTALDERSLAAQFDVSRTPVREALQQLQVQGLIRVVPRQGIYVAKMTVKSLLSMLETLQELEVACVRLAARRISPDQKKALAAAAEACDQVARRGDSEAYKQANSTYHQVLYDASCNKYLTDQVVSIRLRTEIYRKDLFGKTDRMRVSVAEHFEILQAILDGNAAEAEACMRRHIVIAGQGFAELVSTIPEGLLES